MSAEDFFNEIAVLLQTQHIYVEPVLYMRRWGRRTPGNGRFPGHGIVRLHATDQIHFALHTPRMFGTFKSFDEALMELSRILTQEPKRLF